MLVALFFIAGACLAYNYQSTLVPLLLNPLHGEKLVYLNPAGGFSFIFLVSIYAGIALAFPVFLQQVYAFLKPALPDKARQKSPVIIISSLLLLAAGITFGYFVAVPNALTFLYGFADQYVQASLTADSYLNFIIGYTIGIGIVFQVPLLLLLLNAIHPLPPGKLLKSEKWVVLIAFIIAAIITPTPDPINQTIMAVPVIIVYQIGVIGVLISHAQRKHRAKVQARQERAHQILLDEAKAAVQLPLATVEPEAAPAIEPQLAMADVDSALSFEATPVQEALGEVATETVLTEVLEAEPTIQESTTPVAAVTAPEEEKPLLTPAAPIAPSTPKVIDGFMRRRPPVVLPRPAQSLKPQPRPALKPLPSGPAHGFYVDGIIAPRHAAA